jgi:hypothetical protein
MALVQVRRVDIAWQGEETEIYDALRTRSHEEGVSIQDLVKSILTRSTLVK